MDTILRRAFEVFGDDKSAIKNLFLGFSERLLFRKLGELKVSIERNEWLEKHDIVLVKGIVRGVCDWEKYSKRYLPRKTLSKVIERVAFLRNKIGLQSNKSTNGPSQCISKLQTGQSQCLDDLMSLKSTNFTDAMTLRE